MGNEFGHPEWIDFPRQGNNWSYHYCRRRWDLSDDSMLRYKQLNNFDRDMIHLEEEFKFLSSQHQYVSLKHNGDKVIVFERGPLLFVFNFNCNTSFNDYRIPVESSADKLPVLSTECSKYGGHDRTSMSTVYKMEDYHFCNRKYSFLLYLPARSAIVFRDL